MSPEEVKSKITEIEALRKEATFWKIGGTVAILLIAIVCVMKIIGSVRALVDDTPQREEVIELVKAEINNNIVPTLKDKGERALKDATGQLQAEVEKLGDRMPEFTEKAQTEALALAENLQFEVEKLLNETFGQMIEQRKAKIRAMYPNVTDDKISGTVAGLQTAVQAELSKLVEDLFIQHMVELDTIIHNTSAIRDEGGMDLLHKDAPWEVGMLVLEIVRDEFAADPDIFKTLQTGDTD